MLYKTYCGTIVIVGKTNVGKSTLFNQLINKKISIISKKRNTTQNYIFGVHTKKIYQTIYFDTPGIDLINKFNLNKLKKIIYESDITIFIVENISWDQNDENTLNTIKNSSIPTLLIINKIDKLKNKMLLLPHINFLKKKFNFLEILPMSGKNKKNIDILIKIIYSLLPDRPHQYLKSYITNCSTNFVVSEFIREQYMIYFNKELPYTITIQINSISINTKKEYIIKALILVKKNRHKSILIGKTGNKIKKCSIMAKKNISCFFQRKVHLFIWIK
ncbi:GTPase [Buchnera aphidicola (Nipponaphis monzeni)]|uniref:GTPase Era n=1 Tax=Buchnera aphidicola (Nipponaphis monzeni) TaxID=2495405 RepID=A0A455TA48_9GAMM|nr:GTPase Era [Buchnera aphidicola]BBI01214.1 GTPase [Buchnera aphidicola (Nipponaphis monzeni)]